MQPCHETVDEMSLEAILEVMKERDALRARVAELERQVQRLSPPTMQARFPRIYWSARRV